MGEVEEHWGLEGHGQRSGGKIRVVQMQSWGGRKGGAEDRWVVNGGEEVGGGDGQIEVGVKEGCNVGDEGGGGGVGDGKEEVEWEVVEGRGEWY